MARSMWDGALTFGLVNIGVSLRPAEKKKEMSFTLLDRRDHAPVGYIHVNKATGKEIGWDEIVKGYEYEKGQYVLLSSEDFKKANVKATQQIEILSFVDAKEIDPLLFETPYFIIPQKHSEKSYELLRLTLQNKNLVGIGKIVLRTREHLAAVIPNEKGLVLEILRFSHDLRPFDEKIPAAKVSPKELQLAEKLVDEMKEKFKAESYKDTYYEDLVKLIDKRVDRGEIEASKEVDKDLEKKKPRSTKPVDLMSLLRKSLDSSHPKKKPTKRNAKQKAAA
ncbi:MAG: putative repair protein Ku type [Bacteriovoracaceae bacterium]|nr:putative repair protein Ku type [Bacteriovoracaceae bacterium]